MALKWLEVPNKIIDHNYVRTLHNHVPTIMDKSSWDTPRKRPVSLNVWVFQSPIFTFQPPPPFLKVLTTWQCPRSVFQHWKGGEAGLAIGKKRCFLILWKDANRKRLFCSNVWTLVSMIVWNCLSAKINRNCSIYVLKILKYYKHCNRNRLVVL